MSPARSGERGTQRRADERRATASRHENGRVRVRDEQLQEEERSQVNHLLHPPPPHPHPPRQYPWDQAGPGHPGPDPYPRDPYPRCAAPPPRPRAGGAPPTPARAAPHSGARAALLYDGDGPHAGGYLF